MPKPLAWVHTHLPRLQSGDTLDILSVKIPGQRIAYTSWIALEGCAFRVSEPGRQRCIRDNVRNVHAWVVGSEMAREEGKAPWEERPADWSKAVYDPWKGSTFVDADTLEPVRYAAYAILSGKNVYYIPYDYSSEE